MRPSTPLPSAFGTGAALGAMEARVENAERQIGQNREDAMEAHHRLRRDLTEALAEKAPLSDVQALAAMAKETRDAVMQLRWMVAGAAGTGALGVVGWLVRMWLTGHPSSAP